MSRRATVKVKSAPVTRRQAVADFGRKKARQRRQILRRRAFLAALGVVGCYVLATLAWSAYTGSLTRTTNGLRDALLAQTAQAGFRLSQVTLGGRRHADLDAIKAALDAPPGVPILALDLPVMRARLLAIPEVASATLTRRLPGELRVTITERVPVALWQSHGQRQLIDRTGAVLSAQKYREAVKLPVVVGSDAAQHIAELLALLDAAPELKPDVAAAVRIGQRRWNLQLTRGVTVMLPQEGASAAWQRFAALVARDHLLQKAIKSVDLRMEDRVFIVPLEVPKNPVTLTQSQSI